MYHSILVGVHFFDPEDRYVNRIRYVQMSALQRRSSEWTMNAIEILNVGGILVLALLLTLGECYLVAISESRHNCAAKTSAILPNARYNSSETQRFIAVRVLW